MAIIRVVELLPEFRAKLPVKKYRSSEINYDLDERVLVTAESFKEPTQISSASGTLELDKIKREDIPDLLKSNGKGNRSFNKNRNFVPKNQNNGVFINGK